MEKLEKENGKTIKLQISTFNRLQSLGHKGETFDDIVQKLLDGACKS